jgi:hypothetical protein
MMCLNLGLQLGKQGTDLLSVEHRYLVDLMTCPAGNRGAKIIKPIAGLAVTAG